MMEKSSSEFDRRFLDVEENLKVIRSNIAAAALKSGRQPQDITMLAATKTVPVEVINHGIALGIDHIGENKVQELCEKYESYDLAQCELQFIGHLQTNKVKNIIGKVSMIQSVDSVRLANEISRLSLSKGVTTDILIEVNIGNEPNKSGVLPTELYDLIEQTALLPSLRIRGLMAIPPAEAKMAETQGYFSKMSQYFIDIKGKKIDNVTMDYLSMGMSSDYSQAILSGANMVRIGSALFGPRIYN
ncbi:YggS family pyridoxal phosphate-dependent enzyme [Caproiciproducens faecalis]|uniref:Pyridoxal phosphate homeostasis protein n=1 Tax=Caproiciproducens faecalis TaxID=2820301 RepID=A0ABS7DRC1_9FIRM|nr:YggS family pyridoxal phosphate-dependent enzyme [Caproiciproducens faecalis]MBW7573651.1 YggS family pyridoxal phosphate-dependent enzyme [Caproiciproducens faecalis]